jgi:hypothetical protein
MNRIGSYSSNNSLLQQIFRTRNNLFDLESQIGTGKISPVYSGISQNTERLINQENTREQLKRYVTNNEQMDLRINIAADVVEGTKEIIREFRVALNDFETRNKQDPHNVKLIQDNAFNSLNALESMLNTKVDGRYIFAGARHGNIATDFGLTTLENFQSTFDGSRVQVATTRDAHLENFTFDKDSGTKSANWLKFERTAGASAQVDTITVAGTVEVGDLFSVTVNGVNYPFTAASTSANDVATGLAAAVNADAGMPVTASGASGGAFTLTANVGGAALTSSVTSTEADLSTADAQTIVTAATTPNVPGGSLITASSSEFTNVTVGSIITITGTGGVNDGTYEVTAKSGTTLSVRTEQLVDEAANAVVISYRDPSDKTKTIKLNTTMAFTRLTNTMVRSAGDKIKDIPAGTKITISSAGANNDLSYTVKTNDGTNLVIESKHFTDQGTAGAKYFQFTAATNLNFVDGGASADTITAPANTFQDANGDPLPVGTKLVIAGTGDANNGKTYTIASVSNNKSSVTLVSTDAVTAGTNKNGTATAEKAAGSISSTSYFKGDQTAMTHRVDSKRDFEYDINASDAGFEKAIRAMKLILQGAFKTEGGLDQNTARIEQSIYLLNSSLQLTSGGTPPFGDELSSNIEQMEIDLGYDRVLLDATNQLHHETINYLEISVAKIENVNTTETISRLLSQQQTLEASFQAFARIRAVNLSNFLKV